MSSLVDNPAPTASAYDRIAHLYDVDMGRSMPFDDVAFYRTRALRYGRRALELGCGNGRILFALIESGVDAFGIDLSINMLRELRRKAASRGIAAPVARMDARALALEGPFDCVLCPYSLITYMVENDDVTRLLGEARRVLRANGALVIDAFVPRSEVADATLRVDYRRAFSGGELERAKRVTRRGDAINLIEREYRVTSPDGRLVETVRTSERVRPFPPQALIDAVGEAGFAIRETSWDYGASSASEGARFFAVVAER